GTMSKDKRDASLNQIKDDKLRIKVILVSFKAGSTGLNLTACNNVILVDMWWNPALEDQAFDMAHRLEQTRDVHIYKLTIQTRAVYPRTAGRQARSGYCRTHWRQNESLKLGLEDLMALFRLGGGNDDKNEDDD
ncbi:P-loop containing nucleoside triphosphate hydrolase protein, partial [Lactarius quietus]